MIGEIIICCPLIVSESGFDHVPTYLWRASDLKIRGHETLQNNWLACGSSGGLHYVAAEAGRQVLAKVPHLHGGQRGRRQPRSQVLPLACDQVLRHAGATGGHRYVIKPKFKAFFFFVDFDVGLLYNNPLGLFFLMRNFPIWSLMTDKKNTATLSTSKKGHQGFAKGRNKPFYPFVLFSWW